MEGYQAGSKYSFSLTSTQATWSVDDDYLMAITGTNLDTDHGRITSIIADVGAINLFGINVDFNLFHAGMEEHDWTKIGAALKGIDLSFSSKGAYDHFQGLGGDDNITFINTSFYGDKVYFDGGNDTIILGNGSNSVYASSLNYVPDYETLHWEIDGRRGLNSLYLWQDPVTASSIGHQIVNATTKGFDITLGRESTFLDGTALFTYFTYVYATPFADKITGDAADNVLYGEAGVDNLNGAGGADAIFGGGGKDDLYGGAGTDTFFLNTAAGSTADIAGRDVIHDFSSADHDRIDVHLMDADTGKRGNQAFDFIGMHGFHHHAGELRYVQKGRDSFVYGDINGDGKADFALEINGKVDFHATDFHL